MKVATERDTSKADTARERTMKNVKRRGFEKYVQSASAGN